MKTKVKNIVLVLLIFCMLSGLVSCSEEISRVEKITTEFFQNIDMDAYVISSEEFIYQARSNPDLFIIDLRKPEEYLEQHIRYALNIPWGRDLWELIDKIPYNRPVVIYSDSIYLSMQASALLALAGYDAKSVTSGWEEICLVEGMENVIETGYNRFNQVPPPELDKDIRMAILQYFQRMDVLESSMMDDFTVNYYDAVFMLENNEEDKAFLCVDPESSDETPFRTAAVYIPFDSQTAESFDVLRKEQYIIVYGTYIQEVVFTTVRLQMLGFDAVMVQ